MSLEAMLSRLQKVRRSSNNSFMACCPAHDDRTPSLSIKDAGDGKLVLNCLAGCETIDVLGALSMDWADIMPEKLIEHHAKPVAQKVYATDALKAIQLEARIVVMAAFEIDKGNKLTADDMARLKTAMNRINTALELTNG